MTTRKQIAENRVKELRKYSRRTYSVEEKIRIVLLGLKNETNISELCEKEGITVNLYKIWSKEFIEAGRSRLAGESLKEDNSAEIQLIKNENRELKLLVGELFLRVRGFQNNTD